MHSCLRQRKRQKKLRLKRWLAGKSAPLPVLLKRRMWRRVKVESRVLKPMIIPFLHLIRLILPFSLISDAYALKNLLLLLNFLISPTTCLKLLALLLKTTLSSFILLLLKNLILLFYLKLLLL
jgi:hypothetical protein